MKSEGARLRADTIYYVATGCQGVTSTRTILIALMAVPQATFLTTARGVQAKDQDADRAAVR
jgi:hypothetical protein